MSNDRSNPPDCSTTIGIDLSDLHQPHLLLTCNVKVAMLAQLGGCTW